MSPFEYISVLISIILGLGITQLLSGIADLLQQWDRVKLYWPHLVWIVLIFFLHIQEWWWFYGLVNTGPWRLPVFLFVSLYPIGLFILARLLFPATDGSQPIDIKAFYFKNYRKFFLLLGGLATFSFVDDLFLRGFEIDEDLVQPVVLIVSAIFLSGKLDNERWHKIFVVAMLIVMFVSFIIQWNDWLIGS